MISRESELLGVLSEAGLVIQPSKFRQMLFLLKKLGFVSKVAYSNQRYYLTPEPRRFARYSFVRGTKIRDRERWQDYFREFYLDEVPQKRAALARLLCEGAAAADTSSRGEVTQE